MIVKSYEVDKNRLNLLNSNFFLLYGENFGLKKDIKNLITTEIKKKYNSTEILSIYENEILENEEKFYNLTYNKSLFSDKRIIIIQSATDKIIKKINDVYDQKLESIFLIVISEILEKKSRLREFFETSKKMTCVPCYLDSEKDLYFILQSEFKKIEVPLSREMANLLIEKSNFDRNNLRNEIEKIKSYSLNKKKLELNDIKSLVNFSGDHKSDILINECLCGNIYQYKKIISELYTGSTNQILLLRVLSNKIQRLLKIKEQKNKSNNIDDLINSSKPTIFWKERPLVKKQLLIWDINDLKKLIEKINNTELLCKKNPQISKSIFFGFFSEICKKANNFS